MDINPNRVKDIFLEATERPDEARRVAYLDSACAGDVMLRERVEALLRSHDATGSFLASPAVALAEASGPTQELGVAGPQRPKDQTVALNGDGDHAMADNKKTNPSSNEDNADDLQFLSPSTRPDSLGRLGHYEMLQVLGKGGFGIVFRAFDDTLQRVVAIKVMAPQIATVSPARKRFLREARSSAAVRHENVVQVYEIGEQPLPYLAMEFIPGETLQQKLDRSGPLEVSEILRIGRPVAEGLAAAHACELIHRDIKPGNILLEGGSQKVKITDFGLARAADDASISQSGIIAGTPMFMSPEQALGHKIDQRADLFSLGSVLYQMASGRPPFRAPSALAVLKRVAEEPPRPIAEIIPETPAWLCDIIAKLHAKNPDDRFQSAREVADLLADCEAKLKAKQEVKNVLPVPVKLAASARRKWLAAAAVLLLPVLALAVTEFAGVTHLFRQQVTPVTGPVLVAKNELPPLADGWVRLFNGKDLSGWKTHDLAPGNWRVEDGAIVGRGDKSFLSFLVSESEYADFHLRVEAKINAIGDSGVIFRAPFDVRLKDGEAKILLAGGYEAQIAVRSNDRNHTGSLFCAGEPPFTRLIQQGPLMPHRPDEWFVLEVIAQGNRIQTFVNGKKTADCVDEQRRYDRGHLALQTWGSNITFVQFRRIEIKELPPSSLPPTFKNSLGMEFVIVPKGKSWLGGGKDMLGDQEVAIPADFYLGKYEVTQEEWEKVMGENPSFFSRTGGGMDAVKDIPDADLKRFPVENVSWENCQLFVAKLNKLEKETGWVYRLPTAAEWEYACRGGPLSDKMDGAFDFYFAKPTNTLSPKQANFNDGLNRPCKVGSYEPNALSLHDMHGNVWEWCDDKMGPQYGKDSARAVAGGCGDSGHEHCRAGFRGSAGSIYRNNYRGFRLARVPSGAHSPEAKTPPDTKPTVVAAPPAPTEHDTWIKATALLPLDEHAAALPAKLKERLPGFEDAMLRTIPSLAADRQVIMVKAWLRDRNSAFDGEMTHKIEGGVLTTLEVLSPLVQDLTPLRVLPGLRTFTGRSTLGYDNQAARDADVLQSLKTLETINGKPVAEFWKDAEAKQAEFKEWLQLVPTLTAPQQVAAVVARLKERNPGLDGTARHKIEGGVVTEFVFTPIKGEDALTDLSPVRALPDLTYLNLWSSSGLDDLEPLKGLKLTRLLIGSLTVSLQVRDLEPLRGMQLTELQLYRCQVQNLEPLRDMPLTRLTLFSRQVRSCEPLKDMPLTVLGLGFCTQIQDFTPLKDLPLTGLHLNDCRVRDLEPFKVMKLTGLILTGTPVRDLGPLNAMPLKNLSIHKTGVTDLRPLQGMELEEIYLTPKNIIQGLEILRSMKSLKTIGIDYNRAWPAAEFWERYDKGEFK